MTDLKQLQSQIKNVSISFSMRKEEIELLAQHLTTEEQLIIAFEGNIASSNNRIIVSDQRLFLISKIAFASPQISTIALGDIDSVEEKPKGAMGSIIFFHKGVQCNIDRVHSRAIIAFAQYIRDFLSRTKQENAEQSSQDSQGAVIEELERLFALKEKGALTEEEYNSRKNQILSKKSPPPESKVQPLSFSKEQSPTRPAQPKKKGGCLSVLVIAAFLVVVMKIMGGGSTDKSPSSPSQSGQPRIVKPAEPNFTVSAPQIAKEYSDNEIAADQKYSGKTVRITSKIEDIGKDILNEPYITFSDGKEFSFGGVQCYFKKSEQAKLGGLEKGQRVTIQGVVEGLMMNVLMKDCAFIEDTN
jgi:hypothetical protein